MKEDPQMMEVHLGLGVRSSQSTLEQSEVSQRDFSEDKLVRIPIASEWPEKRFRQLLSSLVWDLNK